MSENQSQKSVKVRANGAVGAISMAVIVVAFCGMVVGVCWAGAWLLVNHQ